MTDITERRQTELFHESIHDALKATVAALGGLKAVGVQLWPEKPVDEAARYLSDCLNPDRPHGLHPEKLLLLLRLSARAGVHSAFTWISREIGYTDPTPSEPEDEIAELQRQFIRSVDSLDSVRKRIERLLDRPQVTSIGGMRHK